MDVQIRPKRYRLPSANHLISFHPHVTLLRTCATMVTEVGDQVMICSIATTSPHFSIVNSGLVSDPRRPFPMSDLEALKKAPSSPLGPTLTSDTRHAEALKKLMERNGF